MRILALTTAAAALSMLGVQSASAEAAQSGPYVGVGYSTINFSDADVRVGVINGRIGYRVGPHFAIEGEGAFGIQDDTVTVDDGLGGFVDVDAELDSAWSIFAVGAMPVSEDTVVFARLGYATVEVTAEAQGVSASDDDSGVALGVGGWVSLSDHFALRADYTYVDENVHALGISAQLNF